MIAMSKQRSRLGIPKKVKKLEQENCKKAALKVQRGEEIAAPA